MQLSYTIDNTGSNQRSDAAIPVYTLCLDFMKCLCQGFQPVHVKTKAGGKQLCTKQAKPRPFVYAYP